MYTVGQVKPERLRLPRLGSQTPLPGRGLAHALALPPVALRQGSSRAGAEAGKGNEDWISIRDTSSEGESEAMKQSF